MTFDYWADNKNDNKPATFGYLLEKLRDENPMCMKEKKKEGESVLDYHFGKIVIRGRHPRDAAERLTIKPDGFFRNKSEENHRTLKSIIESSGIKLKRIAP